MPLDFKKLFFMFTQTAF